MLIDAPGAACCAVGISFSFVSGADCGAVGACFYSSRQLKRGRSFSAEKNSCAHGKGAIARSCSQRYSLSGTEGQSAEFLECEAPRCPSINQRCNTTVSYEGAATSITFWCGCNIYIFGDDSALRRLAPALNITLGTRCARQFSERDIWKARSLATFKAKNTSFPA